MTEEEMRMPVKLVCPGKVEVNCPAEEAEGDGEEGAEDDAPVFVVEQVLLVLLVSPMGLACVVGLDNVLGLCSSQCILLASLAALSTRAGADFSLSFIFLLLQA